MEPSSRTEVLLVTDVTRLTATAGVVCGRLTRVADSSLGTNRAICRVSQNRG